MAKDALHLNNKRRKKNSQAFEPVQPLVSRIVAELQAASKLVDDQHQTTCSPEWKASVFLVAFPSFRVVMFCLHTSVDVIGISAWHPSPGPVGLFDCSSSRLFSRLDNDMPPTTGGEKTKQYNHLPGTYNLYSKQSNQMKRRTRPWFEFFVIFDFLTHFAKLLAYIGFLYKAVRKNGRLRKFNCSCENEFNF